MFNSMRLPFAGIKGIRLSDTCINIKFFKTFVNINHGLIKSNADACNICKFSIYSKNYTNKNEDNLLKTIKSNIGVVEGSNPTDLSQSIKKRIGLQRRKRSIEDEHSTKPGVRSVSYIFLVYRKTLL